MNCFSLLVSVALPTMYFPGRSRRQPLDSFCCCAGHTTSKTFRTRSKESSNSVCGAFSQKRLIKAARFSAARRPLVFPRQLKSKLFAEKRRDVEGLMECNSKTGSSVKNSLEP